ncbi:hypothetical protein HPB50_023053 [Hyalomma asiaticum]|uniref:Uncharacterized protein n=1 Tax=Hyalomma asiaticum TaxID=266040 RepID=A0ACB7TMH3_HYAAI|nr:hypothetical protein HPB50_023053 [Hyalomma asiaticum]
MRRQRCAEATTRVSSLAREASSMRDRKQRQSAYFLVVVHCHAQSSVTRRYCVPASRRAAARSRSRTLASETKSAVRVLLDKNKPSAEREARLYSWSGRSDLVPLVESLCRVRRAPCLRCRKRKTADLNNGPNHVSPRWSTSQPDHLQMNR